MASHERPTDAGYDQESEYFHRRDAELLAKKRAELDAKRKQQADQQVRGPHWMKCPKCGHDLVEVDLDSILVDRCDQCGGIYFDAGELEILIDKRTGGGAFSRLKKMFGG